MLLTAPQSVDFFQAALILCMWSTTVGQVPLGIDSWLLSGFALQHSQSSPIFATITSQAHRHTKMDEATLDHVCLWNHLCLAHLHYCVGTSRRSTLQAWQIERCEAILGSDHAINFEVRMVAEIQLYWTVYGYLIEDSVDLQESTTALKTWKRKWGAILGKIYPAGRSCGTHNTKTHRLRATQISVSHDGIPFLQPSPLRTRFEDKGCPRPGLYRFANDPPLHFNCAPSDGHGGRADSALE